MTLTKKIVCGVVLTTATGCQFSPYAGDVAIEKPRFNEIVGTYVFEKQTLLDSLPNPKAKFATIILNSDSTFKVINVPNFIGPLTFRYNGLISTTGKWKTEIVGGTSEHPADKEGDIWGVTLANMPEATQSIEFLGRKPPYKLLITYGDPDEAAVMIFDKK